MGPTEPHEAPDPSSGGRFDALFDIGAQEGEQVASDRILTVPNALSFARLASLPFVYLDLVNGRFLRALVLIGVFASTDWFDGYIARRFDQVSNLGKLLDPLSDRLLVITVGIGMVVGDVLPWWVVAVLVLRDVALLAGAALFLSKGTQPPAVTRIGKTATASLMTGLPVLLLAEVVDQTWLRWLGAAYLALGVVLYYVSAGQYARAVRADADPASGGDAHA